MKVQWQVTSSRELLLESPLDGIASKFIPALDASLLRPDFVEAWAETDLMAAFVGAQLRDANFATLDPNIQARRQYASLLENFGQLLKSNPPEEELQTFLKSNPMLLSPASVATFPKLKLGDHITDFVFKDGSGDYLLVELEKSSDVLFNKDGQASGKLNHARGQIRDWKRYITDNLKTVQGELGLHGITADPRALIVIGRSASLTDRNRRDLQALDAEAPRLRIMTYDDVLQNARAVLTNILGPLWKQPGQTEVYFLSPNRG